MVEEMKKKNGTKKVHNGSKSLSFKNATMLVASTVTREHENFNTKCEFRLRKPNLERAGGRAN